MGTTTMASAMRDSILAEVGLAKVPSGATLGGRDGWLKTHGADLVSISPLDGEEIARVRQADSGDLATIIDGAREGFKTWSAMPAPRRGEVVRRIGAQLRRYKEPLARLITLEMGKILPEARGEVQEMIDIADFALGLSRQLYGMTTHSERPGHRLYEQWHSLGPVGVVTAFNFPSAVWSWNAMIAGVCGDTVIWKPSSQTPLVTLAVQRILEPILDEFGLRGVFTAVIGPGRSVGEDLLQSPHIPLLSVTASGSVGSHVAQVVGARMGRTILELGGNNAVIVRDDACLDDALQAVFFGAVGTAGQRCTSTRRVILHPRIAGAFLDRLCRAYRHLRIDHPLLADPHVGPVTTADAMEEMESAIQEAREAGGTLLVGGDRVRVEGAPGGYYIHPAIMRVKNHWPVVQRETFAPLLYVMEAESMEEAIALQNGVPQGLSSSCFTDSLQDAERFLSVRGSDCGIANINLGTSGAEIGGAFGGEKETGGGRESGSDAWKAYMRRQTVTIHWGGRAELAQGVVFRLPGEE